MEGSRSVIAAATEGRPGAARPRERDAATPASNAMVLMNCKICDNAEGNRIHTAREMRYGSRDEFHYAECARCGCLQLTDPPSDLRKYYPPDYGPFEKDESGPERSLRRWARAKRTEYGLRRRGWVGRLLAVARPLPPVYEHLRRCGVGLGSRILDAGCGGGQLLRTLRRDGFRDLVGVDLYAPDDRVRDEPGLKIMKMAVMDLSAEERNRSRRSRDGRRSSIERATGTRRLSSRGGRSDR